MKGNMTLVSPKGFGGAVQVSRYRLSVVIAVAGLAAFLVVASFLLTSYPVSLSSQGYFQEDGRLVIPLLVSPDENRTKVVVSSPGSDPEQENVGVKEPSSASEEHRVSISESSAGVKEPGLDSQDSDEGGEINMKVPSHLNNDLEKVQPEFQGGTNDPSNAKIAPEVSRGSVFDTKLSSDGKEGVEGTDASASQVNIEAINVDKNFSTTSNNNSQKDNFKVPEEKPPPSDAVIKAPSPLAALNLDNGKARSGTCDLYRGRWIYDTAGPLYTNNTCPIITQMQNCQGNGRPDRDYENYRWKPDQCDLPRFNPRKFLELMRGKKLAFIGDSVARNQMESMLCILWQEEVPQNRGSRRMQRWYFKSTSTTIARVWSSWLVHQNAQPFEFAPEGVTKIFLDIPDETFMEVLPTFDVVVLSSGHWFAKQSVYILDNNIVGGQLWWPKDAGKMKINNVDAFGISVETVLTAIANHPNFNGLAVVRSFSPDHYEGGAWNTGGSCTGKVNPVSEVVRNGFTDVMHEKQIMGFQRAQEKSENGRSKLRLMDITEVFGFRADGHPGPYRSLDPNKKTIRGPHGEPPPQNCLHWCMPGPVDGWNEILLEVIRREFEAT